MRHKQEFGPMLSCCGHLARERMDARLSRCGVTPAQAHVLLYLHFHDGRATQAEVTEFLRVKPPTVNGILERMEEKCLITRAVSPNDGRRRVITLTDRGRERQETIDSCFRETEELITRGFDPAETAQLKHMLGRMIENLEEDRNL